MRTKNETKDDLKERLESYYHQRNTAFEINENRLDPLFVVKKHIDKKHIDEIALICALLSYGNVKAIVKTLQSLDFTFLDDERKIKQSEFPLYRFQTKDDIKTLFLCLHKIIQNGGIKRIFVESYRKNNDIISGINAMIESLRSGVVMTKGLDFLFSRQSLKAKASSPLKRWNMFLRWLVRSDNIDIGLWSDEVKTSDLILPLDTHTFKVSQKLGLLHRKSYDLQSALDITDSLKRFSPDDPIKYDFALYRLGQEKLV